MNTQQALEAVLRQMRELRQSPLTGMPEAHLERMRASLEELASDEAWEIEVSEDGEVLGDAGLMLLRIAANALLLLIDRPDEWLPEYRMNADGSWMVRREGREWQPWVASQTVKPIVNTAYAVGTYWPQGDQKCR